MTRQDFITTARRIGREPAAEYARLFGISRAQIELWLCSRELRPEW